MQGHDAPGDDAVHDALCRAIVALLADRRPGASICPSEAARCVAPERWRARLPAARRAAATLAARGIVRITQGDVAVDPADLLAGRVRGPIRLRLR